MSKPWEAAKAMGWSSALGGIASVAIGTTLMQLFEGFEGIAAFTAATGALFYLIPWVLAASLLAAGTEVVRARLPAFLVVLVTALLLGGHVYVAFNGVAHALGSAETAPLLGALAAAATAIGTRLISRRMKDRSSIGFLIPGLIVSVAVFSTVSTQFALWDSITRDFFDPNAILIAVLSTLGIMAAFALSLTFSTHDRFHSHFAIAALLAGLGLAYLNRFVITPRLYLEAHLALALFEWLLFTGAATIFVRHKPHSGLAFVGVPVLVAALIALALNDERTSRRIDHSAEIFSYAWEPVADRDGDGYYAHAFGGVDCDDADPARYPFAREIVQDGIDQNCTGSDLETLQARPPWPGRKHSADLIILISIDMLRPDYMSIYGSTDATTPNLIQRRSDFVRFDRAYASGGITTLSLPSLTRGRVPLALDFERVLRTTDYTYVFPDELEDETVNRVFASVRSDASPTIASTFTDHGLRAHAFVDDGPSGVFQRGLGYEYGFSTFTYPNKPDGAGPEAWNRTTLTDQFLSFLEDTPKRTFAWLHYYDPHNAAGPCRTFEPTPGLGCYRDSIRDVDHEVGRIFRFLEENQKWQSTSIIITSDHGEALGEHRLRHHGTDAYEEFVRIPLLYKPAHQHSFPRVVQRPVSLIDASITAVLDANVEQPDTFQGYDLRAVADGLERPPPLSQGLLMTVNGHPYRQTNFIALDDRRVMYDRATRRSWAFDLLNDPGQTNPRRPTSEELQTLMERISILEVTQPHSLSSKLP